jgi:hypothetical protein
MQVDMFFCASISFLLGLLFGSIIMIGTGGCKHEYEIINMEKVTCGEGTYIAFQYYKLWLRCKKCGKIKTKRV